MKMKIHQQFLDSPNWSGWFKNLFLIDWVTMVSQFTTCLCLAGWGVWITAMILLARVRDQSQNTECDRELFSSITQSIEGLCCQLDPPPPKIHSLVCGVSSVIGVVWFRRINQNMSALFTHWKGCTSLCFVCRYLCGSRKEEFIAKRCIFHVLILLDNVYHGQQNEVRTTSSLGTQAPSKHCSWRSQKRTKWNKQNRALDARITHI